MFDKIPKAAQLLPINQQVIHDEIAGAYGQELLAELGELIECYEVYEKGAEFTAEGAKDYVPANLRYRKARQLINKEARFLFSKPVDFFVTVPPGSQSKEAKDRAKKDASTLLNFLKAVLKGSSFNHKLVQAARDCFVGKRVAILVNFGPAGIAVSFLPSLEFVYDTDPQDVGKITKLICFYTIQDSRDRQEQRIYRKKYWMQDGSCWFAEEIRDGSNNIVETVSPEQRTELSFIPAVVVVNDGLLGDMQGESEVEQLADSESWFSRLANADMDAERKSMNPIKYTVNAAPESVAEIGNSAGSFWDLTGDSSLAQDGVPPVSVGLLESSMSYSDALSATLDRISSEMHDTLDVPDVSPDALKGVVSSGKTLKAIYWGLIVRCDEKMLTWRPALERVAQMILDGARLYPESAKVYADKLPDVEYQVSVDNSYPLPEDETEEKQTDMQEVASRTRSVKSYLKKWRSMSDDEADEELQQIAREQRMFEDSFEVEA